MSQHNLVNTRPMKELIREHLEAGKTITNVEAQALWRCRALPKRINELKKDGMKIVSEWRKDTTGQSFTRYRLVKCWGSSLPSHSRC